MSCTGSYKVSRYRKTDECSSDGTLSHKLTDGRSDAGQCRIGAACSVGCQGLAIPVTYARSVDKSGGIQMSFVQLIGVGDDVSGETIVNGMNSQGLACTGMSKFMEGESKVIKFEFASGEPAAYRKAQTKADLLLKVSEALERGRVYIIGSTPGTRSSTSSAKAKLCYIAIDFAEEFVTISAQATLSEPPPSSPPRGSLAWAEQILAGS